MIDFFFDIDGTLLPFGRPVPESASYAIRHLRALGHRAFIATGRSVREVGDDIYSLGFDGGVFAGGAVAYIGGRKIHERLFSQDESDAVISFCRKRGYSILVQTDEGTYMSQETFDLWSSLLQEKAGISVSLSGIAISPSFPPEARISKFLYISPDGRIDEIRSSLGPRFSVIDNTVGLPADLMGEVVLSSISKLTGIEAIERESPERSFVVAVGDGANDAEMIEAADLGIAMGNASQGLKNAADYVSSDVCHDGILNAVLYSIDYYIRN